MRARSSGFAYGGIQISMRKVLRVTSAPATATNRTIKTAAGTPHLTRDRDFDISRSLANRPIRSSGARPVKRQTGGQYGRFLVARTTRIAITPATCDGLAPGLELAAGMGGIRASRRAEDPASVGAAGRLRGSGSARAASWRRVDGSDGSRVGDARSGSGLEALETHGQTVAVRAVAGPARQMQRTAF